MRLRRNEVMQTVIHRLLWSPEELEGFAAINYDAMQKDFKEILTNEGPEGVMDVLDEAFNPQPRFRKKQAKRRDRNMVRAKDYFNN